MCAHILMAVASERKGLGASQVCCGSALLFCTFSTSLFSPRVGRSSMTVVATVVHPPWSGRFRYPPPRRGFFGLPQISDTKKNLFPLLLFEGREQSTRGSRGGALGCRRANIQLSMFGNQHAFSSECALWSREEFTCAHIHSFFGMQSAQMQSTKVERLKLLHETFWRMAEAGIAEFFKGDFKGEDNPSKPPCAACRNPWETEYESVFGFHRINVVEAAAWSRELVACGAALASNKDTTYPKNKVYDLFQMCGIKPHWRCLAYAQHRWAGAWDRGGKQELTFSFLQTSETIREGQYVCMQERLEDRKKNKKNMGARLWTFDRDRFERQKDRAEVGAGKKRLLGPSVMVSPLEMLCNVALKPNSGASTTCKKIKLDGGSDDGADDTANGSTVSVQSEGARLCNRQELQKDQSAHHTPQKLPSDNVAVDSAAERVSDVTVREPDTTKEKVTCMHAFYSKIMTERKEDASQFLFVQAQSSSSAAPPRTPVDRAGP